MKMSDFSVPLGLRANIERLAKTTSKLNRMVATIGTSRDSDSFRDRLHEEKDSGMELIHSIVDEIRARGESVAASQVTRTFKQEAGRFQQVMEKIKEAEARVVQKSAWGSSEGQVGEADESKVALLQGQQQIDGRLESLERKKNQLRVLESDVSELAEMFKDVHSLVHQQEETVNQIVVSVEESKVATENAAQQFQQAEEYQRRSRKRKLCCFVICLVLIAVIALVIYLIAKK